MRNDQGAFTQNKEIQRGGDLRRTLGNLKIALQ